MENAAQSRMYRCAPWVLFLLFALLLWAMPAFAQATGGAGSFQCISGRASGALYDSGASCPATLSFDNLFSYLVCNMERLSSDLMGNLYCGMVTSLTPAVLGVVTLAVMFFGVGFTVGVIPATGRDFQKFLIKMAFVTAFATQADYMIGIAYRFFVEGAREGIAISLAGLEDGTPANGASIYQKLDRFLGITIDYATATVGLKESGSDPCKNALFAAMAVMAVAFPPLFYVGLLLAVRIAMTFFHAVFGYIYAIIGIAFLMTLAPFFLSFALFQQTRSFFDKWIGYLATFAFQLVLVFAFLTFVVSINVSNVSGSLVNVVVKQTETHETTSFRFPWSYCTFCDFKVVNKDTRAEIPDTEYTDFIGKGELVCKDNPPKPIGALSAISMSSPAEVASQKRVQNALIKFATSGLLSLLILAYIFESLLAYIPQMTMYIVGSGMNAPYAPQLAGEGGLGRSSPGIPGDSLFDSFGRGFDRGFRDPKHGDSISKTIEGVKEGFALMIGGAGPNAPANARTQDPGLIGAFQQFLVNPHGDRHE